MESKVNAIVAELPLEPGDLEQPFQVTCFTCKTSWCYTYDYGLATREARNHNNKHKRKE